MVGLLGTVIGMIEAFIEISSGGVHRRPRNGPGRGRFRGPHRHRRRPRHQHSGAGVLLDFPRPGAEIHLASSKPPPPISIALLHAQFERQPAPNRSRPIRAATRRVRTTPCRSPRRSPVSGPTFTASNRLQDEIHQPPAASDRHSVGADDRHPAAVAELFHHQLAVQQIRDRTQRLRPHRPGRRGARAACVAKSSSTCWPTASSGSRACASGPAAAYEKLSAIAKQFKNQPVRIRGDGNVAYQRIVEVIDTCQKAGIWNISFATQRPERRAEVIRLANRPKRHNAPRILKRALALLILLACLRWSPRSPGPRPWTPRSRRMPAMISSCAGKTSTTPPRRAPTSDNRRDLFQRAAQIFSEYLNALPQSPERRNGMVVSRQQLLSVRPDRRGQTLFQHPAEPLRQGQMGRRRRLHARRGSLQQGANMPSPRRCSSASPPMPRNPRNAPRGNYLAGNCYRLLGRDREAIERVQKSHRGSGRRPVRPASRKSRSVISP